MIREGGEEMLTSILLAKFLGLMLIIITLALLVSKKNFDQILKLFENNIAMLAKGITNVAVGTLLLLNHNVWTTSLDITTTVVCWAILLVGLVDLFFPKQMTGVIKNFRKNKGIGVFTLVVLLVVGIYFAYAGFTS